MGDVALVLGFLTLAGFEVLGVELLTFVVVRREVEVRRAVGVLERRELLRADLPRAAIESASACAKESARRRA